MDNRLASIILAFISGCLMMSGVMGLYPNMSAQYRQGQIDCANGNMQYELTKQPDGSSEWKRKLKEKK